MLPSSGTSASLHSLDHPPCCPPARPRLVAGMARIGAASSRGSQAKGPRR
uniref:Uncharacterized protein n=1 Tax=Setaria italica TaxID=4555 RepID=K4A431_SETIT